MVYRNESWGKQNPNKINLPENILKKGKNIIAIRLIDNWGSTGDFEKIKDTSNLDKENTLKIKQTVKFIFEILGFELNTSKRNIVEEKLLSKFFAKYGIQFNDIESAMSEFSLKREELRSNKKYGEADKMREDLLEIGIVMNDGENVGWYWKNS